MLGLLGWDSKGSQAIPNRKACDSIRKARKPSRTERHGTARRKGGGGIPKTNKRDGTTGVQTCLGLGFTLLRRWEKNGLSGARDDGIRKAHKPSRTQRQCDSIRKARKPSRTERHGTARRKGGGTACLRAGRWETNGSLDELDRHDERAAAAFLEKRDGATGVQTCLGLLELA